MANTAPAAFNQFAGRLTLTTQQRAKLRERRDLIRGYLAQEWSIESVHFGGSHARGTKIRKVRGFQGDVDVYVVLNKAHRQYGGLFNPPPGRLLSDLRKTFARRLVTTRLRADAPCVRVTYADMVVDVVPAFRSESVFSAADVLEIPYYRDWRRATPIIQQRVFAALDEKQGGRLKPLLRMLKHWLALHRTIGLRSYHLETLAYEVFCGTQIDDYGVALMTFFDEAAVRVGYHVNDPGGSGNRVSDYLTTEIVTRAEKMFSLAAGLATRAVEAPTYKQEIERWRSRRMLGVWFPAWTP